MALQRRAGLGDLHHEFLGVCHLHTARAAHDDGLEVLAAHDGAHAAASGCAVLVVHDAGVQHPALARGADGRHAHAAVLFDERVGGVVDVFAPQLACVEQLDELVVDVQVDGMVGLALEDDAVIACKLELGAKVAAGVGRIDRAGQRALRDDVVASARACRGAGQRAGHEDDLVLGGERVDVGVDLVAVVLGAQAAGAHVIVGALHVERLFADGAVGQVDADERAHPAFSSADHYACTSSSVAFILSAASCFLSGASFGSTTLIAPDGQ